MRLDGPPKLEMCHLVQVAAILCPERLIERQLPPHVFHLLERRILPRHHPRRIAGQQVDKGKHKQADGQQHRNGARQPP